MRAADAIEKITVDHPECLSCYTQYIFDLCNRYQQGVEMGI